MRVLVDEDLASRTLLSELARQPGIEVLPPTREATDEDVWTRAQAEKAVILIMNSKDFAPLAEAHADHAGLLLVSRLNRPGDLRATEIANAVGRISSTYPDGIAGVTLSVNAFAHPRDAQ